MIAMKVAHLIVGFAVAGGVGLLLLAWRERERVDLDDHLVALATMCAGLLFGVAWEFVQFIIDWVTYSDLQQSNLDTMTNFLCNDVGVIVAGATVVWVYCVRLDRATRERLGHVAQWLVHGPSRLLDRHGFLMTIVVTLLIVAAVGVLWFAGRPIPGFPIE